MKLMTFSRVCLCAVAVLDEDDKPLMSVSPSDSLLEAIFTLSDGKVHRLLVVNPVTGNALHVLTYLRILRFIHACVRPLLLLVLFVCSFVMLPVLSAFLLLELPSVLWCCWLGGRKGIKPVKKLEWWGAGVVIGYLSGAKCRHAYSPADATATHCLLLQ